MHEVSIALAIVDELSERAVTDHIAEIATVRLRIGALTSIVPDALIFAWELATDGTPAAGSKLEIERVPLAIECKTCNEERTIEHGTLPFCPVCGTSSTHIIRGRELQIAAMEVVYDAQAGRGSAKHSPQEQHAGA